MVTEGDSEKLGKRRSPCGERGLKSIENRPHRRRFASLPVRGAWVEMDERQAEAKANGAVAPRAGSVG